MPLHHSAWLSALEGTGAEFDERLFYALAGTPTPGIIEILNERHGLSLSPERISHLKEAAYFELLPQITVVPDVHEAILSGHGRLPMAVVSGSPRDSVLKTLNFLGLRHYFEVIIGAEDCARGKPAPDPFLAAAHALGVPPKDCLVFEDADLGVQSAEAAGMAWVRVPSPGDLWRKT